MLKARKTITKLEKELNNIRKKVAKGKLLNGEYGINACIQAIGFHCYINGINVNEYYPELIHDGLTDKFFNLNMIVACEILMEEESK